MRHTIARSLLAAALLACTPLLARAKCEDPPAPNVDWKGCDKRGAKLYGANLERVSLKGAHLTDAYLAGALWIDAKKRCAEHSI